MNPSDVARASSEATLLFDGPADAGSRVLLAHGAGAPMDSPFMNEFAAGLAASGIRVARFEFPYMARRRSGGRSGAPDREPVLRQSWHDAIEKIRGGEALLIGGKSMGGRIASLVADTEAVAGLLCLGYPFHPPGQPAKLRTRHLESLRTPALVLQGTRDPFGTRADVAEYSLSPSIEVRWLEDGDHSWKPRVASGRTLTQNMAEGIAAAVGFIQAAAVSRK